jgi:C2 domain
MMDTPYIVSITRIICKDLKNVDMGSVSWSGFQAGSNDPYVKLTYGSWFDKTEHQEDAGADAEWDNLTISFKSTESTIRKNELKIEVYDYNSTLSHAFIGEAQLSLDPLIDAVAQEKNFLFSLIDKKKKRAGQVTLYVNLHIDYEAVQGKKKADRMRVTLEQEAVDYQMRDCKIFDGFFLVWKVVCEDLFKLEAIEKSDPFVEIQFGSKSEKTPEQKGAGRLFCYLHLFSFPELKSSHVFASNALWDDLNYRFDADETAMRMDFLDIRAYNYRDTGMASNRTI